MKMNIGNINRIIRILLALIVILLYFTQQISGTIEIVGLVLSGIFILNSLIGFCPWNLPFGLYTCKKD